MSTTIIVPFATIEEAKKEVDKTNNLITLMKYADSTDDVVSNLAHERIVSLLTKLLSTVE